MERESVNSSNLKSVGYDAAQQVLEIEFHEGGVYRYSGVPEEVYRALLEADSKGSYFVASIKEAYPYDRVGE